MIYIILYHELQGFSYYIAEFCNFLSQMKIFWERKKVFEKILSLRKSQIFPCDKRLLKGLLCFIM